MPGLPTLSGCVRSRSSRWCKLVRFYVGVMDVYNLAAHLDAILMMESDEEEKPTQFDDESDSDEEDVVEERDEDSVIDHDASDDSLSSVESDENGKRL
ncbi:hypothetical protein QE152_g10961 [Popillia japonica]|uniref:Uncharacterized protein n=1 Tax=Popillia japonica TaxID=7064 RepID=A0AAW1LTL0_POPJA